MGGRATDWCIIQTSSAGTIALVAALNDAGIEAWTPTCVEVKRIGKERHRVEQVLPMMPTFVFARYDRINDIAEMARAPAPVFMIWDKAERRMVMRGRPHFRLFRHGLSFPAVSDRELDKLRIAERHHRPVRHVHIYAPGDAVRLEHGSVFDGLIGHISEIKGSYATVRFSLFGHHPEVKAKVRKLLSAA